MIAIGPKIKTVRHARGLTINDVAQATGLSKSFLSNVENSHTSPSLASLEKIARALRMPLTFFFLADDAVPRVVKPHERSRTVFGADGRTVEFISARPDGEIEMFLLEVPVRKPGQPDVACHTHKGEECHYVLAGRLEAFFGNQRFFVEAGDSFHWDGTIPHKVENVGDQPARLVVSLTPPSFFSASDESFEAPIERT